MNVLIIASTPSSIIDFRGKLIKEFTDNGFVVHIVAPFSKESDAELMNKLIDEYGVYLHYSKLDKAKINLLTDLLYLYKLTTIIKSIRPKFVFLYTLKPVIYGSIASFIAGVPRCFSMLSGLGFLFIDNTNNFFKKLLKKLGQFMLRISLSFNTKIFFQNNDDKEELLKKKIISNHETVLINGSGVDLNYYKFSKLPEDPVFLLIARMIKSKGIYEYIEAIKILKKEFPNLKFMLLGGVEDNVDSINIMEIRRWVDDGLIEYTGQVDDVRPYIKECSIYVLPSYREGTPRSVLEAMSMGRPIITTDAPGCRDTVIDGVTGYLVKVKDSQNLALIMRKLILDLKMRSLMGKQARRYAEEKYDDIKVSKKIVEEIKITL